MSSNDFCLVSILAVDAKIGHGADWHHGDKLWMHLIAVGDVDLLSRGEAMLSVVIDVLGVAVNVSASLGITVGIRVDGGSAADVLVVASMLVVLVMLSGGVVASVRAVVGVAARVVGSCVLSVLSSHLLFTIN